MCKSRCYSVSFVMLFVVVVVSALSSQAVQSKLVFPLQRMSVCHFFVIRVEIISDYFLLSTKSNRKQMKTLKLFLKTTTKNYNFVKVYSSVFE